MSRICINGVWYVPETASQPQLTNLNVGKYLSLVYETDNYCWEASRLYKDDHETFYDDIDIKFTNKTRKPWVEEYWDNPVWFRDILENKKSVIEITQDTGMNSDGINEFKNFLLYLKDKEWL